MRRLPVYFLLDISESMVGEPIRQVEEGLTTIVRELRSDPYALETVWLSIIGFAGKPMRITPLMDLLSFYLPKLPIGGGTSLGRGLDFLMQDIDSQVVKTTHEQKGDWKPIIFLFTDGVPTDDATRSIERWQQYYGKKASVVAVSFGESTNINLLYKLTEDVFVFTETDKESYKKFFRWVTASIKASSASVNASNTEGAALAHTDGLTVSKIDLAKAQNTPPVDDNYAVFIAKCQTSKQPYLIKFKKVMRPSQLQGMSYNTRVYQIEGSFPVDEKYFELTDNAPSDRHISTAELVGAARCPHCANDYGFATCSCGNVMCSFGEGINTCPWCNKAGYFGAGEADFDVKRGRG